MTTDEELEAECRRLRSILDSVHGALADAETVIVRWSDPARSIRELTAQRDSAVKALVKAASVPSNAPPAASPEPGAAEKPQTPPSSSCL